MVSWRWLEARRGMSKKSARMFCDQHQSSRPGSTRPCWTSPGSPDKRSALADSEDCSVRCQLSVTLHHRPYTIQPYWLAGFEKENSLQSGRLVASLSATRFSAYKWCFFPRFFQPQVCTYFLEVLNCFRIPDGDLRKIT